MRRIFVFSALLGLGAVSASAQSAPVSPGWSAFAGCWVPVPSDDRAPSPQDPRVCVVPTGVNSADLVSVVNDTAGSRTRIDANGQRQEVSRQGCNGWESAQFSPDGRRLYLHSEQACIGGLKRVTSGVFAITSNGDWINAVSVGADSGNSVRVSRYSPAALTATIPAEIRGVLEAREVSDRTARIAALAPVNASTVIEASRSLTPPVIEAWLAELEQDFRLDEPTLVRLADAGVAPSVIDVMVAVSHPKVFAVRATGTGYAMEESDSLRARRAQRANACLTPVIDPWAWYSYDPCDPYHRYGFYRTRGYGYGYGYGYGRDYGYYPYGYGWGEYGRPVQIIVIGSGSESPRGHGKMTKDGYSRGTSTSRGTAESVSRPTTSRESRPSDSGSSSSSGSSSGSTSSGSSGSSGGGRTATRKPPAN